MHLTSDFARGIKWELISVRVSHPSVNDRDKGNYVLGIRLTMHTLSLRWFYRDIEVPFIGIH